MSIFLYPKCHRGDKDCLPIHCIDAPPDGIRDDDEIMLNYEPLSFVCCGQIEKPELPQDYFRLCFKNDEIDEMSDNDIQDLSHLMAVISQAMAFYATNKINGGFVEVPTAQTTKD